MKRIIAIVLLFIIPITAMPQCLQGNWVEKVSGDGEILILSDGSVWNVDPVDAIHSMLWLPAQPISICGNKLINTMGGESVLALKIK